MPKRVTVVLDLDVPLLAKQAEMVGATMERYQMEHDPDSADELEGVWNLLHAILDQCEGVNRG